jgi:hypothetical protein
MSLRPVDRAAYHGADVATRPDLRRRRHAAAARVDTDFATLADGVAAARRGRIVMAGRHHMFQPCRGVAVAPGRRPPNADAPTKARTASHVWPVPARAKCTGHGLGAFRRAIAPVNRAAGCFAGHSASHQQRPRPSAPAADCRRESGSAAARRGSAGGDLDHPRAGVRHGDGRPAPALDRHSGPAMHYGSGVPLTPASLQHHVRGAHAGVAGEQHLAARAEDTDAVARSGSVGGRRWSPATASSGRSPASAHHRDRRRAPPAVAGAGPIGEHISCR